MVENIYSFEWYLKIFEILGYGIHLTSNENWRGLHIDDIEPNSPAESAGLLREDRIIAVNGRSIENEDFFVTLSFIQHELEYDQIQFLVLDPYSAELAQRDHINIDENYANCIRRETAKFRKNSTKTTTQNSSNEALDGIRIGQLYSLLHDLCLFRF